MSGLPAVTQGEVIETGPAQLVAGAAAALADWLAIRGEAPGPLFWGTGNRSL